LTIDLGCSGGAFALRDPVWEFGPFTLHAAKAALKSIAASQVAACRGEQTVDGTKAMGSGPI
jgi:hypothetical protein